MPRALVLASLLVLAACSGHDSSPDPDPDPNPNVTHPTGDVVASVALSDRPHGVAAATGLVAVSRIDGDAVTFFSVTATGQTQGASAPTGEAPAHVALNGAGTRAYTTDQFGNSVSVIEAAGAALTATVPLSDDGFNLLATPDGQRVYATTASGRLHVINAATNTVVTTLEMGPVANGLAYHAPTSRLYVTSRDADRVTVVNTATNAIVGTITVGDMPQRIAVSADGTKLYVACEGSGVEEVTISSGARRLATGALPGAVGLALSPDGEQVWVANPPQGVVQAIDVASLSVVRSFSEPGRPRNVAFTPDGRVGIISDEFDAVWFIR